MDKYKDLKPGVHLFQGDRYLKTMSHIPSSIEAMLSTGRTESAEKLLASVAWVHIAITHRRNMINELVVEWQSGDEPVETLPFNFNTDAVMVQIDEALELRSTAYLLKQRAGNRMVGLRWLDPAAIQPNRDSLTVDGYQKYEYETSNGPKMVPAEDIIRFMLPGQREHDPMPSASMASSLAAQLLLGMEETADTFYDTNGLPVIAVIVPDATMEPEVKRTEARFKRIFQRRRSLDGNKTIGLRAGTDIKVISFAPKDLAMTDLEQSKIDSVLLAHGVPPSLVHKDVNRAEAELKMLQFVGTISGRLDAIAKTLNEDEDVMAFGVELTVHKERHEIVQQWELAKAEAIQRLAGVPVMTVNEARLRLELDPVPGGDEIAGGFGTGQQPEGQANEPAMEADATDDAKTIELGKLRRYVKAGKHHKRPFTSDVLTAFEIGLVTQEVGSSQDAPFRGWQGYP